MNLSTYFIRSENILEKDTISIMFNDLAIWNERSDEKVNFGCDA